MKFSRFPDAFASLAALAVAAALAGCNGADVRIDGVEGKPLSELDLSGAAPSALALYGPDEVNIRQGEKLAISVEGDQADALRFSLKEGTLGIGRTNGGNSGGTAVVNVTMPAPSKITAAGSGKIRSDALAKDAEITLAGSGDIETMNVAADRLKVTIAGSGAYRAAGTATKLDLNIVGSGNAAMDSLKADSATIKIAGTGRSSFSSDGEVNASIVGSGEVRVRGRAKCKVSAAGSGRLVCEAAEPA